MVVSISSFVYHGPKKRVHMLCITRLAIIFIGTTQLCASAFAIHPLFSSPLRRINKSKMGTAQSKSQSSLDQGTASIERSTSAMSMSDHGGDKPSDGVSLEAATTAKSNGYMSTIIAPQQQQQTYTPPSSPIKPLAHYIFLVHGWLGNDLEYGYLAGAFKNILSPSMTNNVDGNVEDSVGLPDAKRVRRSGSYHSRLMAQQQQQLQQERYASDESTHENNNNCDAEVVVHSVKCNVGKTHDGIRNGGTRLANEIVDFIRSDVQNRLSDANDGESKDNENEEAHITYSIVGNSLGGLYSRYAISLVPYQLQLNNNNQQGTTTTSKMLNIHPNIFCTTATPHLGVSRHTYLPIPRIAEKIIGMGMGTTGRDLFRLNGDKDVTTAAVAGNIMTAAGRGVQRLTSFRRGSKGSGEEGDSSHSEQIPNKSDDHEECIIRNMCMQDRYLTPLRNFRQRIAYANAYGTDFQVPTSTAAFLHEKSGVGHFVIASRDLPSPPAADADATTEGVEKKNDAASSEGDGVMMEDNNREVEEGSVVVEDGMPSFIIAVVRTEKQTQPQTPKSANSDDNITADDELLQMSQSLDALGWTKVFIDVRDRIPMPGLAKPTWLRHPCGSLDDLIRERTGLQFQSLQSSTADDTKDGSASNDNVESKSAPKVEINDESCILTSQELAASTNAGDSLNFPLGHTVMVANSKNEKYSQLNSQGRPVMDRLAEDMVAHVLGYE